MNKNKLCYEKRNKYGELVSYRFYYNGKDPVTGKLKQYTKTWKVPRGLTGKEIERERKKAELEFIKESEKKSEGSFIQESDMTFAEFAKQWQERILKRNEESYAYYAQAEYALKVLNEYFGRYLLRQITPSIVQRFYDYLCERTYTKYVVTVKRPVTDIIGTQKINKTALARESGIDRHTLNAAMTVGSQISITTAKAVAKFFKIPLNAYFEVRQQEVKYAKGTNNGIRTLLVVILGEAKRQQLVEHNYASKDYTRPVTGTTKQKEIFNEEEAREFVKGVLHEQNPKKKTVLALLIILGLRKAEVCGLAWSDINFENGTLSVNHDTVYYPKFGIVTKGTKTKTSKRTLRMPEQMIAILGDYKVWYNEQKALHGDLWENTDQLFLQDSGKAMDPATINLWLKEFNLAHGLKCITPHALRHTCITMQLSAGIPIKTVSARAGHASERITLDIYAHALQSQDEKAAQIYNSYLLSDNK